MPDIFGTSISAGGSGQAFAAIGVIYPAGATCTCSCGGKTLISKDTSGRALFLVPSAGQWLVKATNGGQEVEDTVSITTQGQVASVTLSYKLVAFDAGTTDSSVGGWSGNASVKKSSLYFYTNNGQTAWGYSGNSIDLKNYTKITFYISQLTSQDNSTTKVGVGTTDGFSASTTLPTGSGAWSTTDLTITVDISSVNNARITIYAKSRNSSAAANMNITKIVLE